MQELIKSLILEMKDDDLVDPFYKGIQVAIELAQSLLPKEKQMVVDARAELYADLTKMKADSFKDYGEEYFKKKYNENT